MAFLALGWIIFGLVIVGILLLSLIVTKYWSDPREARAFPTITITIGFTLVLLTCLLIPVDVYTVSAMKDSPNHFIYDLPTRQRIVDGISILYYGI